MTNKVKRKLYTILSQIEGGEAFSKSLRKFYSKYYNVYAGYASYGWTTIEGVWTGGGIYIGNYCSFGPGIKIYRANHPAEYFTTHPLFYSTQYGYVKKDIDRPKLIIGNDVWIGASAIILPRVSKIGNGAIIGAGSIVTKDVLPYAIVAGNPAKIMRMRFNKDIIKKLEESKWWELDKKRLIENKQYFEEIIKCIENQNP